MRACTRAAIDEGLDIRGLKRYAAVAAAAVGTDRGGEPAATGGSIAVVGAGPAGLAAAHRLRQLGHRVIVLDEGARAGGSLADTVPAFVLPRAMVDADVDHLRGMGVEFRLGVRVGVEVAWEELEREHGAVVIATGARRGLVPDLPGRDLAGVLDAGTFCRGAGEDGRTVVGDAVISGGGFAALQAARVAVRLGARKVTVVHPAPEGQWPAGEDAIRAARCEGVEVLDLSRVAALEGDGGRLTGVGVKPLKAGGPDAVGRRPLSGQGKAAVLEAAVFVAAVDRRPGAGDPPALDGMRSGVLGNLLTDPDYRLGRARWFCAGEAATGAATVVDSMGTGRRAADAVHRCLSAGGGR
jgi:NADPH-dependent glutamate synthase beta subunit-like oxidoreductase